MNLPLLPFQDLKYSYCEINIQDLNFFMTEVFFLKKWLRVQMPELFLHEVDIH